MDTEKGKEKLRTLTDGQLVKESLLTKEAFSELVNRYYDPVYGFIFRRLKERNMVEDLTQETFLEAYRSLKTCSSHENFSTWLFAIAKNRIGKWLRKRRPAVTDPAELTEVVSFEDVQQVFSKETLSALESALSDVPEESREVLKMKYQQGKSCDEIAKILGRPTGTIKSLLSRTYQTLKAKLKPFWE